VKETIHMRRTFAMIDIVEVLTHWYAGRSKAEVGRSLGVHRDTVAKYVSPAEAPGFAAGGPAVSEETWCQHAREWFPELYDPRLVTPTDSPSSSRRRWWMVVTVFVPSISSILGRYGSITLWVRLRRRASTSSGHQDPTSSVHSARLNAWPPGDRPTSLGNFTYLRTVFGSTPRLFGDHRLRATGVPVLVDLDDI
jgi:hypothetical protein